MGKIVKRTSADLQQRFEKASARGPEAVELVVKKYAALSLSISAENACRFIRCVARAARDFPMAADGEVNSYAPVKSFLKRIPRDLNPRGTEDAILEWLHS